MLFIVKIVLNESFILNDDGDTLLYTVSDRLETFIVNYADPANPVAILNLDTLTSAVLYYGTEGNARYETKNNFLKSQQITINRSKGFYDIDYD